MSAAPIVGCASLPRSYGATVVQPVPAARARIAATSVSTQVESLRGSASGELAFVLVMAVSISLRRSYTRRAGFVQTWGFQDPGSQAIRRLPQIPPAPPPPPAPA